MHRPPADPYGDWSTAYQEDVRRGRFLVTAAAGSDLKALQLAERRHTINMKEERREQ